MENIGADCFAYRARNNLTQEEMGKICGVGRGIIINAERNRPISRMAEMKITLVLEGKK